MKTTCGMCGREIPHEKNEKKKSVCVKCLDVVRKKIGLAPGRVIPVKTIEKIIHHMS